MKPPVQFDSLTAPGLPAGPVHLAIGIFDGLHLGHQSVIEAAVHSAREGGGQAGVLTFWPHPSTLFRPENPTRLIMPPAMKQAVLDRLGIDFAVRQPFTNDFAQIEARDFLPVLIRAFPRLVAIYVGENWRFGRGRGGDVAVLVDEARRRGLAVFSAPRLNYNGAPISSSRIRELLLAGDIAGANALLGYGYFTRAVVQPGRRLGRTIGFPTLNLPWDPELRPRLGVYAVTVTTGGDRVVRGVANYGLRPTVGTATTPLLEVHLLGPSAATYGDQVTVNWLQFLRPECKFNHVAELQGQIAIDRERALDYFQTHG